MKAHDGYEFQPVLVLFSCFLSNLSSLFSPFHPVLVLYSDRQQRTQNYTGSNWLQVTRYQSGFQNNEAMKALYGEYFILRLNKDLWQAAYLHRSWTTSVYDFPSTINASHKRRVVLKIRGVCTAHISKFLTVIAFARIRGDSRGRSFFHSRSLSERHASIRLASSMQVRAKHRFIPPGACNEAGLQRLACFNTGGPWGPVKRR